MKNTENYSFQRVRLNIRWCDYVRIRAIFPVAYKAESAADYFQRFAMFLKLHKNEVEAMLK